MLKYITAFILICTTISCHFSSGSGNIVTEKRNVSDFDGVNASQGFDVEIKIGSVQEVTIEADDNLIGQVETKVSGGVLKISLDEHNVNSAHLKAFITVPSINMLKASSAATIISKDQLTLNGEMDIEASSASKIVANVNAPMIKAHTSSGSTIQLSGRTKDLDAQSSSGASIDAFELLSENTKVNCSSGASAHIHASLSLDASASSGANISYRGGANVKKSVSSGGEVIKE